MPRQRRTQAALLHTVCITSWLASPSLVRATHHFKQPVMHTVNRRGSDVPLHVTNQCDKDIYPAILTQTGGGPPTSGFLLIPGNSTKLTVSANWQGRVWGRTNCTFDENGNVPPSGQGRASCTTGDCGQFVECAGAVSHIQMPSNQTHLSPREMRPLHSPSSPCPPPRSKAFMTFL